MAKQKTNLSDKQVKKIAEELRGGRKQKDPAVLQQALKQELEGLSGLELLRRESEIREQWTLATEKTTAKMGGFLEGLLGPKIGKAFAKKYARADDKDVEKASAFFEKYKKEQGKKEGIYAKKSEKASREFSTLKKAVMNIRKDVNSIRKSLIGKSSPVPNKDYYFDTRMSGGGRWKEAGTDQMVSAKDVQMKRGEELGKAIAADEDPMIRVADSMESIMKSLGKMTKNKTIHEKLDEMKDDIENVGGGSWLDFLDTSEGDRRGKRGGKKGKRGGGGRSGGGRSGGGRSGGGRSGGGGRGGIGKVLAGAGAGYLAYSAVDSMRDPNLVLDDPEFLKKQAEVAQSPEEKNAVGTQIAAQKKDVKIRAAATGASVAGAVGGAKLWTMFMGYMKKRAPSLFAKVGVRLAAAAGLATVPVVGWIASALTVVGSIWLAYDVYSLWKEFNALDEAEKALYDGDAEKSTGEVQRNAGKSETAAPSAGQSAAPSSSAGGGSGAPAAKPTEQPGFFAKAGDAISSAASSVSSFFGFGGGGGSSADAGGGQAAPSTPSVAGEVQTGSVVQIGDELRKGGTVSWRTNNPGNISYAGITKKRGAIGTWKKPDGDAQQRSVGIAIMPTLEAGERAQMDLWRRPMYIDLPIEQGVSQWVTGKANPVSAHTVPYAKDLAKAAGVDITTPIRQLNDDQLRAMVKKQAKWEGFKPGTIEKAGGKGGGVVAAAAKPDTTSVPPSPPIEGKGPAPKPAAPPAVPSGGGSGGGMVAAASSPTPAPVAQTPSASSGSTAAPAATASSLVAKSDQTNLSPVQATSGSDLSAQSVAMEDSKLQMQAAQPPVVNNIQAGQSGPPPSIPRTPSPKAPTRPQDSTFMRALAKDFAHPTAFTTVSMT